METPTDVERGRMESRRGFLWTIAKVAAAAGGGGMLAGENDETEAHNNPEDIARNGVDLVEVNHFHDEQGRLVFDQVLFYDWSPSQSRYLVRAWRLLKTPAQIPRQDFQRGGFVAIWHDGDLLRKVQGRQLRETWTQYDPELVSREFRPKEQRPELATLRIVVEPAKQP